MKLIKLTLLTLSSLSLLALGACSGGEASKSTTESKPAETTTAQAESGAKETSKEDDGHSKGGQVVETGDYHLEFLTHKADSGVSLDFIIQKGEAHTPVTDAKVTAQVQLPDGTQQALDMKYDAGEKVYKAILPKPAAGEYKVAVLSDVDGKKMNSRFTFKQ